MGNKKDYKLGEAAQRLDLPGVLESLEAGADPNSSYKGLTPMAWAIRMGGGKFKRFIGGGKAADIVSALYEAGADPELRPPYGFKPHHPFPYCPPRSAMDEAKKHGWDDLIEVFGERETEAKQLAGEGKFTSQLRQEREMSSETRSR